ncbi:MAG: hypothetical protein J6S92_11175, partial [Oscillospiraceae bacterium]|nr:hypothetical protein [Oscillospiraceae bacterium]
MKSLDMKMLCLIFLAFCAVCFLMMALYRFIIIRYVIVVIAAVAALIKRKQLMQFVNTTIRHK